MRHHGCDEYLPGQPEIFRCVTSAHCRGIFNEKCHGIQKFRIGQDIAANGRGGLLNFFQNDLFSLLRIDNDEMSLCFLQVILIIDDGKRNITHEAMPMGHPAALKIFNGKRDNFTSVQSQDPVDGPGKTKAIGGPAHGFFERDRRYEPDEQGRQEADSRLAI